MTKKILIILVCLTVLTGCSGEMTKLGVENGLLTECPQSPNCVNSQAIVAKHLIQPILFIGTSKEAQALLLKILNEWKQAHITITQDNYIRAEFVSKVFRFVDDVEFYFPETERKETIIHVRSASRVGHSDFGANRKRIELIRNHFE